MSQFAAVQQWNR